MGEHKTNPVANDIAHGRPTCASCPHFYLDNPQGGHCRRYPPTAFYLPQVDRLQQTTALVLNSSWPPTRSDRYCGEHPDFIRWQLTRERIAQ